MEPEGPELFAAWGAMVRVCERVLGSREDAEDCASEALLQAFADGMDDVENVEAWLVTVAKCRAMDMLRRRARTRRQLVRLASRCDVSDADPAERVADESEARWLSGKAEELLTAPARAVLRVVADGGSVNDAAHRLAMSRRSAESHLHRARLTLRAARMAVPAFVVALARSVRRPAAASSVALVASAAIVTPVYLTPSEPAAPARPVTAAPVLREVTRVSPGTDSVVQRRAVRVPSGEPASEGKVAAAVRAPAREREVASVTSAGGTTRVLREDRGGSDAPMDVVRECVERFELIDGRIGC